jgi:F-type H+-transporting ATPase subunit gamma
MASLKEMRNRIASVKATQKITKAMQMVAAAKLRRSQDAAEGARPYALMLAGTGSDKRHLVVVAASDRGLAGGFNGNIVRAARDHINELIAEGKSVSIVTVGKKTVPVMKRLYGDRIVGHFDSGAKPSLDGALAIAHDVTARFERGDVDVVSLFYSRFKSVVQQIPTQKQLIPASVEAGAATIDLKGAAYEYEPAEDELLGVLLPRNLNVQIFSAMLENQAGFYASQMAAMDNATRNAGDMIRTYTIQYNRTRQAQITKELIEIISGAEAL